MVSLSCPNDSCTLSVLIVSATYCLWDPSSISASHHGSTMPTARIIGLSGPSRYPGARRQQTILLEKIGSLSLESSASPAYLCQGAGNLRQQKTDLAGATRDLAGPTG